MPGLLSAGDTRLREIERKRALAAGLQQSALGFEPILHPLQGVAKLAQALVSQSINKKAGQDEESLAAERAKALGEALAPVNETIQGAGQQIDIGVDESDPINIPGRRQQITRNKSSNEALAALAQTDPRLVSQISGNVLQQQALAERGITPQQLAPQKPTEPKRIGLREIRGLPGRETFEAEAFEIAGQPFIIDKDGTPTLLGSENLGSIVDRTQALSPVQKGTATDLEKDLASLLGQEQLLERGAQLYDPSFLTIGGKLNLSFNRVLNRLDEEGGDTALLGQARRWKENVNQLFNAYRKDITGAAAAIAELESLKNAILNEDLTPAEFQASVDEYNFRIQQSIQLKRSLLQEGLIPGTERFGEAFQRQINFASPAPVKRSSIGADVEFVYDAQGNLVPK